MDCHSDREQSRLDGDEPEYDPDHEDQEDRREGVARVDMVESPEARARKDPWDVPDPPSEEGEKEAPEPDLFGDRDVDGYLLSLRAGGDRDPRGDRLDREVEDEDRAQTEEEIGEEEAAPYLLCQGPLFRCDHEGDPRRGEGDDVSGDYHRCGAGKAEEEEERDPYDDQAKGDEIDFDGAA